MLSFALTDSLPSLTSEYDVEEAHTVVGKLGFSVPTDVISDFEKIFDTPLDFEYGSAGYSRVKLQLPTLEEPSGSLSEDEDDDIDLDLDPSDKGSFGSFGSFEELCADITERSELIDIPLTNALTNRLTNDD